MDALAEMLNRLMDGIVGAGQAERLVVLSELCNLSAGGSAEGGELDAGARDQPLIPPNPRDLVAAGGTSAVVEFQAQHGKVHAGDQGLAAARAETVVALVTGHVANVDVLQPLGVGDRGCGLGGSPDL